MAEHSAVNRRVVGSSPTWGVSKRDHQKVVFFDTHLSLVGTIAVHRTAESAVNCKDAELLAVRDERRRLWRSGRNFASKRARSFGYHKSQVVGSSRASGVKRRKDHPEDGPFLFNYINSHLVWSKICLLNHVYWHI